MKIKRPAKALRQLARPVHTIQERTVAISSHRLEKLSRLAQAIESGARQIGAHGDGVYEIVSDGGRQLFRLDQLSKRESWLLIVGGSGGGVCGAQEVSEFVVLETRLHELHHHSFLDHAQLARLEHLRSTCWDL